LNTALENITHTTTKVTGIGSASGLPEGVTAALASNTITISGTPSATGIFNYSIALTGSTCNNVIATGTITVTDVPPCGSTITYNDYPYKTVGIGTQCWMAENLRTRKYRDGTDIQFDASGGPTGDGQGQTWGALTSGAHTLYAHDSTATPSNLTSYGYLYNWYAVQGRDVSLSVDIPKDYIYKNICPTGWHVPTDSDWNKLVKFIDSGADTTGTLTQSTTAGDKMKSTGTTYWDLTSAAADNTSGFTALPGGFRNTDGGFLEVRSNAVFWSATESDSNDAWYRYLFNFNGNVYRNGNPMSLGSSVRCLRD
jgi:uncharacterized protein (TIGR02145 family)